MSIINSRIKIQQCLVALENQSKTRLTAQVLAGLAVTLRLLPTGSAEPPSTTQLTLAAVALLLAILLCGPVLNAMSGVFRLLGNVPGWLFFLLLGGGTLEFFRQRGKSYFISQAQVN